MDDLWGITRDVCLSMFLESFRKFEGIFEDILESRKIYVQISKVFKNFHFQILRDPFELLQQPRKAELAWQIADISEWAS